ncbi:pilus assembly protein [Roseateles sp. BYS87W]|uniref:Pilus assembly protein n=1 Tax=Pelomonas baiyunensis TaxID=3299026 RepID=A0ABW7GU99_9BURK
MFQHMTRFLPRFVSAMLGAVMLQQAMAAATDVSQAPLIVATPSAVKPNLLFILDDSGSMNFDFLPDHINGDGSPDPALCRSSSATASNSGSFNNTCCINGNSSSACWLGAAPFGTRRGQPPYLAADFNGLAYDPDVSYVPPVTASGSSWPSQTSANTAGWTAVKNDAYNVQNTNSIDLTSQYPDTEWCTDNLYTDCLRNDNYVLPGYVNGKNYAFFRATTASGSGQVATGAPDNPGTANRNFGPHYYVINAAEYCDDVDLRRCRSTAGSGYTYPAPVRWCNSDANARAASPPDASCQATRNGTFSYARFPTKFFTSGSGGTAPSRASVQFTISSNASCYVSVTAVNVNNVNILAAPTTPDYTRNGIGQQIAAQIMARSNGLTPGAATAYSAVTSNSGRTVTIYAPWGVNINYQVTFTTTPCTPNFDNATPRFSGYSAGTPPTQNGTFAGSFQRIDILPGATFSRASTRKDCVDIATRKAAGTCTYDEEMTNFANWWTYYHSRMQSMKSSASLAFGAIGSNRRVGYMSINNNTSADFLNLGIFSGTQKTNWFSKLTAAIPSNSTPLRTALSTAGQLYAGRFNGTTLNSVTVTDPVEYSCQKNFTILSTDGFWNENATPTQKDGSTAIGDQDSGSSFRPPIQDGNATSDTLADVAMYYASADLRTGTTGSAACTSGSGTGADVCGNSTNLAVTPDEKQVMKTFTLGLGASGYMQFSPTYLTDTRGDFYDVSQGRTPNASAGVCSWQSSGVCTWPIPASNTLTTIDDLWHAAINGGGTYFSASNPTTLYTGLTSALQSIDAQVGAAAAATTSNPNVSAGDNQVFVSNFKSSEWSGELQSQRLDVTTGIVDTNNVDWSARDKLNANASRTVYMFSSASTNNRKPFEWSQLTSSEKAYFTGSAIASLSQFCAYGAYCLSSSDQTAAAGEPLVKFIAGDRTNEGDLATATKYFRKRAHVLGDIVNSEAVYVKQSLVNYGDTGYDAFKNLPAVANRQGVVYVGSNDGMLHAFSAATGDELWAFVPTAVLPNLFKLADKQYSTQHQYFVDGTPVVQDVYVNSQWITMLVTGLGAGGRSYVAIDVTDPLDPKPMWEFTNNNLGLTIGKPEIGKLANGTWAVIFGSGYNNGALGDGNGRLFVLNAGTGSIIRTLETKALGLPVGNSSTPSGLAHIRAWVDNNDSDNTIQRVYGGDNLGNLWRFDVNDNVGAPGYEAQRIATLKDGAGNSQPITSRPELGDVNGIAMVYVGTGRYLGTTDLTDTSQQSIYGIKDRLNTIDIGNPRLVTNSFVQQTLTVGTCPVNSSACSSGQTVRTSTSNTVNLATDGGWFVDLPQTRERVNTDPQLALGTLVVNSNVIDPGNLCKVGGSSWANFFDYRTGAPISTAQNVTSVSLGDAVATRPSVVKLPNNKVISITRLSNDRTVSSPTPTTSLTSPTRRLSWRDLVAQ